MGGWFTFCKANDACLGCFSMPPAEARHFHRVGTLDIEESTLAFLASFKHAAIPRFSLAFQDPVELMPKLAQRELLEHDLPWIMQLQSVHVVSALPRNEGRCSCWMGSPVEHHYSQQLAGLGASVGSEGLILVEGNTDLNWDGFTIWCVWSLSTWLRASMFSGELGYWKWGTVLEMLKVPL